MPWTGTDDQLQRVREAVANFAGTRRTAAPAQLPLREHLERVRAGLLQILQIMKDCNISNEALLHALSKTRPATQTRRAPQVKVGYWQQASGQVIKISEMETSHIMRSLNLLRRKHCDMLTALTAQAALAGTTSEAQQAELTKLAQVESTHPKYAELLAELNKRIASGPPVRQVTEQSVLGRYGQRNIRIRRNDHESI